MQSLGVEPGTQAKQATRYWWHKAVALVLTAAAYALFHSTRKVLPVVKSVLNGPSNSSKGWPPFMGDEGKALLGELDLAFLGTYAACLIFSGHIADQVNLKWFLTAGMVGSGLFCIFMGVAYFWHIHYLSYFVIMSVCAGAFQSTGWPSVVSVVANWSGKGKRGLVMGIWSTNMPLGNILGTVIAAALLPVGWGWPFIVPGLSMVLLAVLVAAFLIVRPADAGLASQHVEYTEVQSEDVQTMLPLITKAASHQLPAPAQPKRRHQFIEALCVPGVLPYALCLFFAKVIAYTFLTWLPFYIRSSPIGGRTLTPEEAGHLSVLFDVGGIAGGILAGHLSDKTGASALVTAVLLSLSIPSLWVYRKVGDMSLVINMLLMALVGALTGGPQGLIATAVSADLGNHDSLQGNMKIQATVIAIIDGVGSVGSALGPLVTGLILQYSSGSFDSVFIMLEVSALASVLMLVHLALQDVRRLRGLKQIS